MSLLARVNRRGTACGACDEFEGSFHLRYIDSGQRGCLGERLVLLSGVDAGPLVHGFAQPPYYASVEAGPSATFPLLPLSLNSFAAAGQTDPSSPAIFDSGSPQTIWHRLFLEAIVPPRCGVLVWLAATDTASDLMSMSTRWYPHVAGDADVSSIPDDVLSDVPRATWQSVTPEVAFAPALLEASPVANRQGLFMVLLQRAGKAVRN